MAGSPLMASYYLASNTGFSRILANHPMNHHPGCNLTVKVAFALLLHPAMYVILNPRKREKRKDIIKAKKPISKFLKSAGSRILAIAIMRRATGFSLISFGNLNFGPLILDSSNHFSDLQEKNFTLLYNVNDIYPSQFKKKRKRMRFEKRDSPSLQSDQITIQELYTVISGLVKAAIKDPITSDPKPEQEDPPENQPSNPVEPEDQPANPVEPENQPINPEEPENQPNNPEEPENQPLRPSCKAAVIADNSFFEQHKDEPEGVEEFILSLMNEVSGFYQNQVGIPFTVDFVFASRNPNDDLELNSLPSDPQRIVPAVNRAAERINGLDTKDFCIVITLTSKELSNNAVGVSFVGTVCSPNRNTAVITDINGSMPRLQLLSVIMHEIGHLFGANHDTGSCAPNNRNQRFVMFPSVQPSSVNLFKFSPCSLENIQYTLNNIDTCFFNEKESGRGNGINFISAGFSDKSLDDSSPKDEVIVYLIN
ncbi:hypothetical protein HK099_006888 [Clydaea vesicula]|uniref:Peptidase M12B domain-containing protein n=1 Tax=Clydaea vesicula TaxID=447962 RepID=A0AAD5TZR2_9FUNG|nr:hypothetical protein HK099_006888 [Clydaea vesicula]